MGEFVDGPSQLRFVGVCKRFGEQLAVADLNLEVAPGELFGLIGPNGAGKTTTLKMAVGLLRPSAGRILICGHDVQSEGRESRRHLGYVPDSAALYDRLTGSEMLQLAADLQGVSRERRRRRIPALLEAFDLSAVQGQLILSYSRGMRQKLALCAALVHDPQVLFLDEPTVGLDPRGARQLKLMLRTLCDSGHTVFLSTHALEIAAALCDRIGIFSQGTLAACGTVAELAAGESRPDTGQTGLEDAFMAVTGSSDDEGSNLLAALRS
ncbi:MAG TPA: ABC transporter ATP-binding protein [Candidatus Dormibacteraeota bacterium]|nr:ABC transporter ATP-binding protein [Candidatus Dormibacteraeota bacterium]